VCVCVCVRVQFVGKIRRKGDMGISFLICRSMVNF
jgi:hypothetical protein